MPWGIYGSLSYVVAQALVVDTHADHAGARSVVGIQRQYRVAPGFGHAVVPVLPDDALSDFGAICLACGWA